MIRVHVHGAGGRMGRACVAAVGAATDLELVATSGRGDDLARCLAQGRPDVVIEFTVPAAAPSNLRAIAAAGAHAVSGTTGLEPGTIQELGASFAARGRGLVLAPNFAIGVLLLQRFAREAVRWFPDVEVIESHGAHKLDAPSGTALATARGIAAAASGPLNADRPVAHTSVTGVRGGSERGVPIHSVRLPGMVAHQEVLFGGQGQVLTLRHDALDRTAYMPGVLLAVRQVGGRVGLVDGLEPLLDGPGR